VPAGPIDTVKARPATSAHPHRRGLAVLAGTPRGAASWRRPPRLAVLLARAARWPVRRADDLLDLGAP
jgi:hypothetical protein